MGFIRNLFVVNILSFLQVVSYYLKLCRVLVIVFVTFMPVSLLLQEFRGAVEEANKSLGRPVVPGAVVDHIIRYLPQLQCLNEELLADLKGRLDNWYCQL